MGKSRGVSRKRGCEMSMRGANFLGRAGLRQRGRPCRCKGAKIPSGAGACRENKENMTITVYINESCAMDLAKNAPRALKRRGLGKDGEAR